MSTQLLLSMSLEDADITGRSANFFLYLTAALIVTAVTVYLLIRHFKPENLKTFYAIVIGVTIGYAIAVLSAMLFLNFTEMRLLEDFRPDVFWPVFSLVATVAALSLAGFIVTIVKPAFFKRFLIIAGVLTAAALVVMIVFLARYYSNVIVPENYYSDVSSIGLSITCAGLVSVICVITLLFGKKRELLNKTKPIVYGAMCIAMSFALSYMRLFKLPQGGSITFASVLPLLIYSYIFGVRKGVLAGITYGILQAVQDPYIIHPVQFLLDYPVAFSALGLAGLFRERGLFKNKEFLSFALGALLAGLLRYSAHVFSGAYAFAVYAYDAGYSAWAWGFLYNLFVFADLAIAIAAGVFAFASKQLTATFERIRNETFLSEKNDN